MRKKTMKSYIVCVTCYLECSVYILIFPNIPRLLYRLHFFLQKNMYLLHRELYLEYMFLKQKVYHLQIWNYDGLPGFCVYTVKYKKERCLLIKNTTFKMLYKSNFKVKNTSQFNFESVTQFFQIQRLDYFLSHLCF